MYEAALFPNYDSKYINNTLKRLRNFIYEIESEEEIEKTIRFNIERSRYYAEEAKKRRLERKKKKLARRNKNK